MNISDDGKSERKTHILDLTDDLLSKCLVQLTLEDLRNAELSCRRFYDTVYTSEIWRQKCESALPDMADVLSEVDTSDLDGPFGNDDESDAPKRDCIEDEVGNGCAAISFYRLSNSRGHRVKIQKKRAALKKLCYMLSKNECEESLIFRPVHASSQDQIEERISNLLDPDVETRTRIDYWSSTGSEDENSSEWVSFQLAHPLCVVTGIQVHPYRAVWQVNHPIYSPKRIQLCLGGIICFDTVLDHPYNGPLIQLMDDIAQTEVQQVIKRNFDIDVLDTTATSDSESPTASSCGFPRPYGKWYYESEDFPMAKENRLQTFRIPPTLCVGGFLKLRLIGRTQRQPGDELYYTCLGYVRCIGKPLYHFSVLPKEDRNVYDRHRRLLEAVETKLLEGDAVPSDRLGNVHIVLKAVKTYLQYWASSSRLKVFWKDRLLGLPEGLRSVSEDGRLASQSEHV